MGLFRERLQGWGWGEMNGAVEAKATWFKYQ